MPMLLASVMHVFRADWMMLSSEIVIKKFHACAGRQPVGAGSNANLLIIGFLLQRPRGHPGFEVIQLVQKRQLWLEAGGLLHRCQCLPRTALSGTEQWMLKCPSCYI